MRFFKLLARQYDSDTQRSRHNPIEVINTYSIPGIACSQCGETWAGSRRLYFRLPERILELGIAQKLRPGVMSDNDWFRLTDELRRLMNLPGDFRFMPGDILGTPIVKVNRPNLPHQIMFSWTHEVILISSSAKLLADSGLTGFTLIEPLIKVPKKIGQDERNWSHLSILHVVANFWRANCDPKDFTVCDRCRRLKAPSDPHAEIDLHTWDGSDFFNLDSNPNQVYITEAAKKVLDGLRCSNVAFQEVVSKPS